MTLAKEILYIVAFALIAMMVYNLLKIFVLPKIKINKWIVLTIAVLVFFVPALPIFNFNPTIMIPIQSLIFVILFLWFFDMFTEDRKNKTKKIKIKPKAKPNRAKSNENKK
ncbi:hypothetical protein [Desnuesiella massiliensis]|uniref:hypothetical protein n=1 Tax=Desnuesiella massiliensis TaxID=1650662 RepID=UPI0006E171A6|nr:hypothetical protein [Desnuesiella massiliensis]